MADELLSIVLPNYNHAAYVGNALQAMLDQSYRNFELIVIDDGSTDESIAVIEPIAQRDSRVRFYANGQNLGVVRTQERGFSLAQGEYLYLPASDDWVLPGFFEKSIRMLQQHPQAGLCCSDPAWFDQRTSRLVYTPLYWSEQAAYLSPERLAEVICGGFIATHATIYRRASFLTAGRLANELRWHADLFTGWVVAFRQGIGYIPEPLAVLRVQDESFSVTGRRNWADQQQVLYHLLTSLRSAQYQDILPYAARGSLLSHFNENCEMVRMVMSHPEFWDATTLMLIQDPLWDWSLKLRQTQQERLQRTAQRSR